MVGCGSMSLHLRLTDTGAQGAFLGLARELMCSFAEGTVASSPYWCRGEMPGGRWYDSCWADLAPNRSAFVVVSGTDFESQFPLLLLSGLQHIALTRAYRFPKRVRSTGTGSNATVKWPRSGPGQPPWQIHMPKYGTRRGSNWNASASSVWG